MPPISPLADLPISPRLAALPRADMHVHQEWSPRLDRVLASRLGFSPARTARLHPECRAGRLCSFRDPVIDSARRTTFRARQDRSRGAVERQQE